MAGNRGEPARRTQDDGRGRRGVLRVRWSAFARRRRRAVAGARASFGETRLGQRRGRSVDRPDREAKTLKERALSDTGVQTMLDVFAAEIKDVEEM